MKELVALIDRGPFYLLWFRHEPDTAWWHVTHRKCLSDAILGATTYEKHHPGLVMCAITVTKSRDESEAPTVANTIWANDAGWAAIKGEQQP